MKHTNWVALVYLYLTIGQLYYGDWLCLRIFTGEALFQKRQQSIYILKNEKNPTILVDVLYYIEPVLLGPQSYLVLSMNVINTEYGW